MVTRDDLKLLVLQALSVSSDGAPWVQIAKHIWHNHEAELRNAGDRFYKWQYEVRWAIQQLRREGRVQQAMRGQWRLHRP